MPSIHALSPRLHSVDHMSYVLFDRCRRVARAKSKDDDVHEFDEELDVDDLMTPKSKEKEVLCGVTGVCVGTSTLTVCDDISEETKREGSERATHRKPSITSAWKTSSDTSTSLCMHPPATHTHHSTHCASLIQCACSPAPHPLLTLSITHMVCVLLSGTIRHSATWV